MKFGEIRLAFDRLHIGTFVAGAAALSAAVRTCVTRRIPRTPVPPDFPAEITPQPHLIPLPGDSLLTHETGGVSIVPKD